MPAILRRSRAPQRITVSICAVLALAAIGVSPAGAHLGRPKSVVTAGPYRLVISAGPVSAGSRAALAFAALLTNRATGAPVSSASLQIDVAGAGLRAHAYRATGFGGVYSLLVPIPSADGWRSLRFGIGIRGPLGVFRARYIPPSLLGEWLLDPLPLALAAIGMVLFLQGFIRLRRRGRTDHASLGRLALFAFGTSLMLGALVSPLDPLGDDYLLSAHMLQHVLIGDAAPALLLLAVRGPLVFFMLPRRAVLVLGHSAWIRRAVSWLLRPRVALAAWALAYGGWHIPPVYDYAATHQLVHDLEHLSFVVAGLLVWSLLIDPTGHGDLSRGKRLGVAAAVFAMGTVIADVLIFSLRPLYPAYADQAERVFRLTPLRDQQLAGLVMNVEQIVTLGTFAVVVLLPVFRARRRGDFVRGRERLA